MLLQERIEALIALGEDLKHTNDKLEFAIHKSYYDNRWFVIENIRASIAAIQKEFLNEEKLKAWIEQYNIPTQQTEPKSVGLITAGNIPLVGFHDFLCVFLSGHKAVLKPSEKDRYLLAYCMDFIQAYNPKAEAYLERPMRLKNIDAVIATGSNNTARYFENYFGKYPNIIRKNRRSVAVLDGTETKEDLYQLGHDVFDYFGLGCRNVSKLYVPRDYDFAPLLHAFHRFKSIILHNKYKNNFDYNYALLILNRVSHLSSSCILLIENSSLQSRIAQLHYEFYDDLESVEKNLHSQLQNIQCIVSKQHLGELSVVSFGQTQQPSLTDYADNVDTMEFLCSL